jgi:glycosyltransferase involved in cell wall biosynthesis
VRICIIGKFPPIEGGVSMRTYWSAHQLARRGHDVQVVTNAEEAQPPFRMHMRAPDWRRCDGDYGEGRVTVHWTDPIDRAQSYLPMASPFVSKLAAIALRLHAERPFDVIFSHYLEPYGVAGHLVAQASGVPHVVRMAGSDSGRLWHHPQLAPLYDLVLRRAAVVIAAGTVAARAIARGVDRARIASAGGVAVPEDLFAPLGPALDIAALCDEVARDPESRDLLWGAFRADRPYFGICGKLGARKGSFALLAAMARLKRAGLDIGLVALAHGEPAVEREFRAQIAALDLADRVLQLPFLPHWRVPLFLRGCLAVCCLEQDFPIAHHTPILPLEVLLCGKCLVGSAEVIRKLPDYGRLPHGYGCVAIEDVNDIDVLSERLAAIVADPAPAAAVGARGYAFARMLQKDADFPERLERILAAAAAGEKLPDTDDAAAAGASDAMGERFPLTRIAAAALAESAETAEAAADAAMMDLPRARRVLAALERGALADRPQRASLAAAVRVEVAIAAAESAPAQAGDDGDADPLFPLCARRWALDDDDLAALRPIRSPGLRLLAFDDDIAAFRGARGAQDLPPAPTRRPSYIVVFAGARGGREPLLVDRATARILELSDGTRTASEIMAQLKEEGGIAAAMAENLGWIETLFIDGLVRLRHPEMEPRPSRPGKRHSSARR